MIDRKDHQVLLEKQMTEKIIRSRKRFDVALSFPGEYRDLVELVAYALIQQLSQKQVFYDKWYEAELARLNLDVYLQSIYSDQAELIVVFLCAEYEKKEWCNLEWRAIRDLIKQKQDETIMLISLDGTPITGVFGIDGYLDAMGRKPVDIGNRILKRLHLNRETVVSSFDQKSVELKDPIQQEHESQEQGLKPQSVVSIVGAEKLDLEMEANYARLQDLLKIADWKGADQETRNIVFKACNRFQGETLESEDIRQFSDSIFLVIDQLWLKHSEGRFGFSPQQVVWHELESLSGVTYKIFKRFSQSVGWCEGDSWLKYEKLNFSLNAPVGHFPYCRGWIFPTRNTAIPQRFHALMLKSKKQRI